MEHVTIRKRVCDFLLLRNSNLGPILHRFGDMTAFTCSWLHPYFTLIFGVFSLQQIAHVGVSQSRGLKLNSREITVEKFQSVWKNIPQRHRQTDGETDGQTNDTQSHNRATSRGKN